ncbi:bacteriohemerythrin [Chitinivibrio alkaliphilus]|uniref:Hemerythrin family non-heme iron protein n=1 Tax=Chitinivibrio alkaliphilus ACht1 TaxID=1313304 RepID=U7DE51_9BACT|nr:hemerythrin domain-containing protein [Chitinivibrio alkaliphilus]ERP39201.1 hemerythrin family non-heme iron protein [Chitinivibrio alkaliphilus ACht1]
MSTLMLKWDDSFCVGDVFIDSEHQILFTLAQHLREQEGRLTAEQVKQYVQLILEYTQVHFRHEEDLLRQIEWEHIKEHRKTHRHIIDTMKELIRTNRDIRVLQEKMRAFVNAWVLEHIVQKDSLFKQSLIEKRGFFTL